MFSFILLWVFQVQCDCSSHVAVAFQTCELNVPLHKGYALIKGVLFFRQHLMDAERAQQTGGRCEPYQSFVVHWHLCVVDRLFQLRHYPNRDWLTWMLVLDHVSDLVPILDSLYHLSYNVRPQLMVVMPFDKVQHSKPAKVVRDC